ncbi:MAG TPA: DUF309 domain-containing protein [Candidatus Acidoferrales bacterium]|jgi:hypothetical protein
MNRPETKPAKPHSGDESASREHHAKFRSGLEQFNSGRFFDAHETWEEIWLASPEPEKTFLQGIIQIAAAFHHYGRGNLRGTRSLIEAGLRRLERFPAAHLGIELEHLRGSARHWAAQLGAGHDPGRTKIPRIHIIETE